jgi:DNA mismatch repair protein MutS2
MTTEPLEQRYSADAYDHAVEALELRDVLEHIASKCVNEGARIAIRALRPTTDREGIVERLEEIREACDYHEEAGQLPIADTSAQTWVKRASEAHETIPPEDLLAVAAIERAVQEIQRTMRDQEERYPRLSGIVAQMTPHGKLIDDIERCLERDGTLKDKASRKLFELRKGIARTKDDIRGYTDKLAKSLGTQEYATFTGNRYLLLVPREKCRRKEGIVHSASHSGGSLYFEPFSLVEKNNSLETLFIDERAEAARILSELSSQVVAVGDELLANMRLWERLDTLNGVAVFSRDFECTLPAVASDGSIRLVEARHPLLELSLREANRAQHLVPLHLRLEPGSRAMVITGPNAGGKTVTLKTVGLLTLMFQCGLPVPSAEGTELTIFDTVFADIGDEQSIASSLSTFTSHLRHLDHMCRKANDGSLCLIDEIGDGTDPDEGSALAIAALERLLEQESAVVATTHYGKVKSFALNTNGVENASVLFDDDNGRPLYRLLQGMAGRSRGIETARRLEFFEPVIRRAQAMLGKDAFRLETLLAELESTRVALERERESIANRSGELDGLIASYGEKDQELREFKQEHETQARKEAEELVLRARKEIESIVKEIRETSAAKSTVREAHDRLGKLLDAVRPAEEPKKGEKVAPGDRVSLSPSGHPSGRVVNVKRDNVTIEIEGKRINAKPWDLYKLGDEAGSSPQYVGVDVSVEPMRSTTVDVRGKDREEALSAVDMFLDRAVLNGIHEVTIIHGVGEEILLGAIQSHLRSDSRVQSVRAGETGEGGRGVSVVRLR